ncbi:cardiolipin synthase [Bacillus suaedae]|uniref:Cardiolipin synthase n=1 Tax=Halalkalibacter suaedae TaxID=2822140 RepID=A0A940WXP0_9BACI|nr:cardiolipin synthase [Bacillus suaedae]MBP3950181.1 cardiolipin synthase [Bacillus suaedae]
MKRTRQVLFLIVLAVTFSIATFTELPISVKAVSIIIYGLIILSIIYVLILENRSPYRTLLWVYALMFLPVIGYMFFLYSGQLEVRGHLYRQKREQARELLNTSLSFRSSSYWDQLDEREQCLSQLIKTFGDNPISFHSTTDVLKNGEETFSAIKEAIQKAESYIHLEYFTFESDEIGQEMIDLLCEKAGHSVEVRLIYDSFGSSSLSKKAIKQMKDAGIAVASFEPVQAGFLTQKLNFRNHRKIIVVDGDVGFVGGLNIGDEYLGRDPNIGFWRDTHLVLKGEVVKTLQKTFLLDWSYTADEKLVDSRYFESKKLEDSPGGVQILASGPDSPVEGIMGDLYYELIASAKKSVFIATPYFIPNKALRTALSMAGKKGIDVKIITPEINDSFLTKHATRSYFTEMLDYDIEIYLYQKGFLHEKMIMIDEEYGSIGTANFDLRSLHLNFEINAFLFETESVKDLVKHYREDLLDSQKVERETYEQRGILARTKESFARLFSPIL